MKRLQSFLVRNELLLAVSGLGAGCFYVNWLAARAQTLEDIKFYEELQRRHKVPDIAPMRPSDGYVENWDKGRLVSVTCGGKPMKLDDYRAIKRQWKHQ